MSELPRLAAVVLNPCRKCGGERDNESPQQGRYGKLCKECRTELAAEIREANARAKQESDGGIDLARTIHAAEAPAKRFQQAIAKRDAHKQETTDALAELNDALNTIRATARALMNHGQFEG